MRIKKKVCIIIISLLLLFIIGFLIVTFPWWLLAAGLWLSPNPPKPEITYGEFQFEFVYKIGGEVQTIEDTIVCEFDGFDIDEGRRKTRKWKEYFKNEQGNELFAFRIEDPAYYKKREPDYNQIVLENIDHYKVVLGVADAEYFLGEPENKRTTLVEPNIQVYDPSIGYYKDPEQSKVFLENIGFEVVSWSCDKPIENTFK